MSHSLQRAVAHALSCIPLTLALSGPIFIPVSHAEESTAPTEEKTVLPPVIVTSKGGSGEDYLSLPARADTLTGDSVRTDQTRFIGETLSRVPGVYAREVNPWVPAIGIRMPSDFNTPYFLPTLDGIPLVAPLSFTHHSPSKMSFATGAGDLEVLKGPASVLYGSSAVSSVVNLRTQDPTALPESRAQIEVGQRNFVRARAQHSTTTEAGTGVLVAGTYTRDDGWRESQDGQKGELTAKVIRKLSDTDTLTTTFVGNATDIHQAGYLDKETFDSDPTQSGVPDEVNASEKGQYGLLSAEWRHRLSDVSTLVVRPFVRVNQGEVVAFWETNSYPTNNTDTYSVGSRLAYERKTPGSELTIGIDADVNRLSYSSVQTLATVSGPIWNPGDIPQGTHYDFDVDQSTISPFVNYAWNLTSDLRMDIGARGDLATYQYDNQTTDGDCDSTENADGKCGVFLRVADRNDTFTNLSPKAGLSYTFSSRSSAFASFGRSFRIPTATDLYALRTNQESPELSPEIGTSYELGYKYNTPRLGLNLSVYQIDIKDRVVQTQGTSSEFTTWTNAGQTRHRGVEIGGAAKATSDLHIELSMAFSENKFIDYIAGDTDYSGNLESQAPKQIYHARVTYNPGFLRKLSGSLEWNRISSYWVEDANENQQEGYDLFNIRTEYQISSTLAVNARILNLANTQYVTDVANYGFLLYRPGTPRTAYVGVEAKF